MAGDRAAACAARAVGGGLRDDRKAFPDMPDIGVEVVERERQLAGIEPLGAAAELGALEFPDDCLKALDLAVAAFDDCRHVARDAAEGPDRRAVLPGRST